MRCSACLSVGLVTCAGLVSQLAAQPALPRPRAVSAETAAKLSLNAPKFVPPVASEVSTPPLPDLREADRPKNGILRLPDYIVREPKSPVFKNYELLTPAGRLDLAYKRRPGLHFTLPFLPNHGLALFMLQEDFRLERMAEMNDALELLRFGSSDSKKVAKALGNETFIRRTDWVTSGGPWKASHPTP